MAQSRYELIKNRVCTFAAHLFHRCLDLANLDDTLIDLVVCVGNKLERKEVFVNRGKNKVKEYLQN